MKITSNLFLLFTIIAGFSISIKAQFSAKPFSVTKTNFIVDLKTAKATNPKLTAEEFAKIANSLLEKQGMNFTVGFDAATCQKISQVIAGMKDKTQTPNLRTTLKSPVGESASLILPEISFSKTECSPCFIQLPILEVTAQDFVTLVQEKNIKFYLPSNFIFYESALVDDKDLSTVKTRWKIPFRTTPLSVSDNGNILYLGFNEPELADLVLMAYSKEGVYQFGTRTDLDEGKKGTLLKDLPKDAPPNLSFIKFTSSDMNQVVRFPAQCGN